MPERHAETPLTFHVKILRYDPANKVTHSTKVLWHLKDIHQNYTLLAKTMVNPFNIEVK